MIEQTGRAVRLFLGLTVGSLGFAAHLLVSGHLIDRSMAERLALIAAVVLLVSAGFGVWCILSRLADLQQTSMTARARGQRQLQEGCDEQLETTGSPEPRTWRLLWAQSLFSLAGLALLVTGVVLQVITP